MLKKRTRRILTIIILMVSVSSLESLIKLLIAGPLVTLILMEWDEFKSERIRKKLPNGIL